MSRFELLHGETVSPPWGGRLTRLARQDITKEWFIVQATDEFLEVVPQTVSKGVYYCRSAQLLLQHMEDEERLDVLRRRQLDHWLDIGQMETQAWPFEHAQMHQRQRREDEHMNELLDVLDVQKYRCTPKISPLALKLAILAYWAFK